MDEVTPDITVDDLVVDGSDNNPLYTLIDGLVDSGTLELFSVAPYWRLPQSSLSQAVAVAAGSQRVVNDGETTISERKMIRIKVPDDFLRVAEIDHTSFQRPITEVVPEISELGKRQHNPFLMAKEARPVGVLSHGRWTSGQTTTPCLEIDCYSIPASASESGLTASYIAKPESIYDDEAHSGAQAVAVEDVVPEVLFPALQWLIASRAFGARGDSNHAAICQQNAQNVLV